MGRVGGSLLGSPVYFPVYSEFDFGSSVFWLQGLWGTFHGFIWFSCSSLFERIHVGKLISYRCQYTAALPPALHRGPVRRTSDSEGRKTFSTVSSILKLFTRTHPPQSKTLAGFRSLIFLSMLLFPKWESHQ